MKKMILCVALLYFVTGCSRIPSVTSTIKTDTLPAAILYRAEDRMIASNAVAVNGTGTQRFGTYITTGNLSQLQIDAFRGFPRGARLRFGNADITPSAGTWSYGILDNALDLCVRNGMSVIFQCWRSPADNVPLYWRNAPYSVPIVNTTGNAQGVNQFPYYLWPAFQALCNTVDTNIANHLVNLSSARRAVILAQMGNYGTTGDYGDYKGEPLTSLNAGKDYSISDPVWVDYTHSNILHFIALNKARNPWLGIAMNPDNNARDWEFDLAQGILYIKTGEIGHGYNQDGSLTYFLRLLQQLKINPLIVYFSESEGVQQDPNWTQQDFFPLVASFLGAGGKILSVAETNNVTDISLAFLNKHAGNSHTAFSVMHDEASFNDTTRFPVSKYGPVIAPDRLQAYQRQLQKINADATSGEASKAEKRSMTLVNYADSGRIKKIEADLAPLGYRFNPSKLRDLDGGLDVWQGNWEKGLYMVTPSLVSVPAFRYMDSTNAFGRTGRTMKSDWYFDIDSTVVLPDTVSVEITYKDISRNLRLTVQYARVNPGPTLAPVIRGTGDNLMHTAVFKLPSLKRKGMSSHDFCIRKLNGNTIIQMVETE